MAASGRPASMHVDDYERNPGDKGPPGTPAPAEPGKLTNPAYLAVRVTMRLPPLGAAARFVCFRLSMSCSTFKSRPAWQLRSPCLLPLKLAS